MYFANRIVCSAVMVTLFAALFVPSAIAQSTEATVQFIGASRKDAPIPRPGMTLNAGQVAVVITDPQNDFLSPKGVAWGVVGQSVTENKTVENIDKLFRAAHDSNLPVFVSPHYYYPHDHQWKFEGALEALMHKIGMFDRKGALIQEGFTGSGADWLEQFKPYIQDGRTVVTSPHKIYGPESNDLVLQLRKAGINQVILAGMSANLCVESHMRELIEQGFQVVVVADATAAAKLPGYDGFEAAFVNYRMIASDVWSTAEAAKKLGVIPPTSTTGRPVNDSNVSAKVSYKTAKVGELDIFYREAGPTDAPTVLLLHGFPTSSNMFSSLIPALADHYHVIAPDYPGFGNSSAPPHDRFDYSFDNLAAVVEQFVEKIGVKSYALYLMDYGAPIGYRIASRHPQRVTALIVQNGNAYDEGLDNEFWKPIKAYWADRSQTKRDALRGLLTRDATIWQYTHGVRNKEAISPDNWNIDQPLLDRPGNNEIQLDLFLSYGTNPPLYPSWQEYFRKHQPPTLIVWGKNDQIFPAAGSEPYKRDLKKLEFHLLNTGHFALEEDGAQIARLILGFLDRNVKSVNK
jgi:pimeloyl-ACP methyl ester carboxylesterase/nicotinamidase-related amidase